MATYVNNLRLKEIGTGDESGTWGTSTNTNLELIGEALGFGTEAITTNADTHTTTIADGSADAGRAIYLIYTGTLDSACTITIGPNTLKRIHIIKNGTSGSQNILISQGSGANITIPPGDTKVVSLDGAGSGAAVTDVFASLSVVDLKVQDDLTVTDDLIVNGDIDLEGSIDVNGTMEADAVTIGGTALNTVIAGVTVTNASTAAVATTVTITDNENTDEDNAIIFTAGGDVDGGNIGLESDGDLTYNPSTGRLSATQLAGTLQTAAQANVTSLGTLTTLTVDDITINGSTISDAGEFTIDCGAGIVLDADGGEIVFKDDGTSILDISNSSSDAVIGSKVSDKDLIFKGNDGGSTITALTLDMSAAGAATFNNDVTAFSDKRLKTDISNIENGLDKVMRMQGVHYKRNDVEDAKPQIGVLAQDMETVVPEVVLTADDEMQTKSVDYGKLTAVLIEAIKDLKAEINELKG
jgi:hypothetical protein